MGLGSSKESKSTLTISVTMVSLLFRFPMCEMGKVILTVDTWRIILQDVVDHQCHWGFQKRVAHIVPTISRTCYCPGSGLITVDSSWICPTVGLFVQGKATFPGLTKLLYTYIILCWKNHNSNMLIYTKAEIVTWPRCTCAPNATVCSSGQAQMVNYAYTGACLLCTDAHGHTRRKEMEQKLNAISIIYSSQLMEATQASIDR